MSLRKKITTLLSSQEISHDLAEVELTIRGGGVQKVSGESYRQHKIRRLAGAKTSNGPERTEFAANLQLEPNNEYDKNAVAVYLGSQHVGYIPKGDTAQWHKIISQLDSRGLAATCRATVTGGWKRRGGDEGHYGVTLDVQKPLRVLR